MTIYFAGGEDSELTKVGVCSIDTATANTRNTTRTRCSLKVGPSAFATDGWTAVFSAPQSSFWATARVSVAAGGITGTYEVFSFNDGANRRLILRTTGSPFNWQLSKRTASGTYTNLATSSVVMSAGAFMKLDVQVTYGPSGSVNFYIDGTLVIAYSGDVTTDGATTLSSVVGGPPSSVIASYWSEFIVSSTDTRSMSLATLPPAANGNTFNFTGAVADINEVTLSDTTLASSATAGQIAETTVTSSSITGNPGIHAVIVSARAMKGGTGPTKADLLVRTGGTDYASADISLPTSLSAIRNVWDTNPATGTAWAYTDLTAAGFNIGIKSVT